MLTITTPCPRCLELHAMLQLTYSDPPVTGNQSDKAPRESVFRCTNCLKLVVVRLEIQRNLPIAQPIAVINPHSPPNYPHGDIRQQPFIKILEIQPQMPKDEIPDHLPLPVAKAYADGVALLAQGRWTASAAQFRTAIDRTTRLLWSDSVEGDIPFNLGKRIEKLAVRLVIPSTLVAWAEAIRGVGNEIHALDEIEEEDAKDAGHFSEVFLTYTYTLPERLKAFRARRESAQEVQAPSPA